MPAKHADDSLFKTQGGSSVYTDKKRQTISAYLKEREDSDDFLRALMLRVQEPPPVVIIVADDPDYVFPPGAFGIQPLPFRCPHCKARVKRARLDFKYADRSDSCLCMSVTYRRDTGGCSSSTQWKAYRDLYFQNHVQHQATAADGQS